MKNLAPALMLVLIGCANARTDYNYTTTEECAQTPAIDAATTTTVEPDAAQSGPESGRDAGETDAGAIDSEPDYVGRVQDGATPTEAGP